MAGLPVVAPKTENWRLILREGMAALIWKEQCGWWVAMDLRGRETSFPTLLATQQWEPFPFSYEKEKCSVTYPLSSELKALVPLFPTLTHQVSHAVRNNSCHILNVLIFGEDHLSSRGQGHHFIWLKTQRGQDLTPSSALTPRWVFSHQECYLCPEGRPVLEVSMGHLPL